MFARGVWVVGLSLLVGCSAPAVRSDVADAGTITQLDAGNDAGVPREQYRWESCAYVGALDRIGLWRLDVNSGECVLIGLVNPGNEAFSLGLTLPQSWGIERTVLGRPEVCGCDGSRWFDGAPGVAGAGEVTFDSPDGGYWPRAVSIEATLTFDGGTTIDLSVHDLSVEP